MREARPEPGIESLHSGSRIPLLSGSAVLAALSGAALIAALTWYVAQRDYRAAVDLWKTQLSNEVLYSAWTLQSSLQQSEDDARVLADFPPLRKLLLAPAGETAPRAGAIQQQVLDLFEEYRGIYEYAALYLLGHDGQVILQAADSSRISALARTPELSRTRELVSRSGRFSVSLAGGSGQELALVFMMPVAGAGANRPSAGVVAIIDPLGREIVPLLSERSRTQTGETLLMQSADGRGCYVSPRRYPVAGGGGVSDTLLKAASAARGEGIVFGRFLDYRGVGVMAAMQKIPAIDGIVVAKVDSSEALAGFYRTVRLEVQAAIAAVLALLGMILVYRRSVVAKEMQERATRQELLNERLETTVAERTSQLQDMNRQLHVELAARQRAEEEIRKLNADLEQRVRNRTAALEAANKELESFSYSVSHDLRAPLRGIDGWSLALLEDCGDQLQDEARSHIHRVRSETKRMGGMIDDLLQISRVSYAELRTESVDLTSLAHAAAENLKESNPERDIEFAIEPGLSTIGDPGLLDIALTNLLGNAVKFTGTRAKARVEFGRTESGGEPAFYVRDNGVGFDMRYADMLFGAFQRLHSASAFPGTGIGLATVQRIVRRHGGHIRAEARPNEGATFYFVLPVGDGTEAP